jgi:hypothetical protein
MHVAGKAADESFIDFNFPAQLSSILILQGKPDTVHHKPRGFLSNPESAGYFITANSILAIAKHPNSGEPLIKPDCGILKNGSNLNGELPLGMVTGALPHAASGIEFHFLGTAYWADHALGPTLCHEIGKAIVGAREVYDCFLKGSWFAHGFCPHKENHSKLKWMSQVNYCPN